MEENTELEEVFSSFPFCLLVQYEKLSTNSMEPLDFWTKESKGEFNRMADKHACHKQKWLFWPSVKQTARGGGPGGHLREMQAEARTEMAGCLFLLGTWRIFYSNEGVIGLNKPLSFSGWKSLWVVKQENQWKLLRWSLLWKALFWSFSINTFRFSQFDIFKGN